MAPSYLHTENSCYQNTTMLKIALNYIILFTKIPKMLEENLMKFDQRQ
jgi:hypothetical protein